MKTLKRLTVALLALLPLATGTAFADTEHGYSRLFVFGASFVDSGNHFAVTGETAHPPFVFVGPSYGVGGHHFSNGSTWVEVLAQEMGLTEWANPAYRNPAFGNYAFGYARAVDPPEGEPDPLEPSLFDQVKAWETNGYCTYVPMDDTLFIVDSGYFDALDIVFGADPMMVLSGMAGSIDYHIGFLHDCGARNFLIALIPPLEASPIVSSMPAPEDEPPMSLSAIYNYGFLLPIITSYAQDPDIDININVVDFYDFVSNEVLARPGDFGLTNITDACVTFGTTKGAFCKNRDEYFFWDPLHPTKKVHALLAEYAYEHVPVRD